MCITTKPLQRIKKENEISNIQEGGLDFKSK